MAELERVRVWAEALIRMHLDSGWTFAFDNAKKRAGACHYADKRITVSRYLSILHDDDDVHQTLLHEVAHAQVGPEAGHGPKWRAAASDLGYVGARTHSGPVAEELAPWRGVCPSGHTHVRYRRPARAMSCAKCSRGYSPKYLITWTKHEVSPERRRQARRDGGVASGS